MNAIKQNRTASFIIVTGVYIIAAVVGVITYRAVDLAWWVSLLLADIAATVATFVFSLIFRNASVYDPYWSVQPPVILAAFAAGKELTALGICLLVAVFFWGIRLTANWAYTFANLNHQEFYWHPHGSNPCGLRVYFARSLCSAGGPFGQCRQHLLPLSFFRGGDPARHGGHSDA